MYSWLWYIVYNGVPNASISMRMLIVNKYNEVSCTLDYEIVQTMHSSIPHLQLHPLLSLKNFQYHLHVSPVNNVTNTMAAVQHTLSLLPLLSMLKWGHGTTPLSTRPHSHFTVDCIRSGEDTLFNFAFICFGKSLETCETRIFKILIKQDKFSLYNNKVNQKHEIIYSNLVYL